MCELGLALAMTQNINLGALPPVPRSAQRFRSDNLDEIRELTARFAAPASRLVHGAGPLGFAQAWLSGTAAVAGWSNADLAMTVRGALRDPCFHVCVPVGVQYRFGRRSYRAAPGAMMFIPPGWEYSLDRPAGASFALLLNASELVEEIEARDPAGRGEPLLRARPLRLDERQQARLAAAIGYFVQAAEPGRDRAAFDLANAGLLDALAGVLLETGDGAVVRGLDIASSRMRDLEAWIEAHLEEPISIGRLCAVAGVGERALQKGFESRRGMSPMRFVTERRIAEARRQLVEGRGRDDVTHVALRLGFNHTGRFATLYRQVFGESPSQSLGRARGRSSA